MFQNTENKDFIRQINLQYIIEESEYHNKKLKYFGLPSEGLYDIIQWNEYLEYFVAVEMGRKSNPSSKQNLLVAKAMQYNLHLKMKLLRGEINSIILNDRDDVGQKIPYPFELINLDYGGSILYPDRIRTEALRILVQRQRPTDFLMFITSNVREYDEYELKKLQDRVISEVVSFLPDSESHLITYFVQINESESYLRQIIHLHFLIKYLAEENGYDVTCFPAINYEGSRGTQLLHYIFRFRYEKETSTRVVSDQSLLKILKQKHQKLVDGKLVDIDSFSFDDIRDPK